MPNYKGMHEEELKENIRLRRRLEQVERENERLIEELSQTKKEVTDREDERDEARRLLEEAPCHPPQQRDALEALEEVEVVLRSVAGHSDQPMMAQAANDALNRCSGIRRALAQSGEGWAGWKLVPVEPTEAMLKAASDAFNAAKEPEDWSQGGDIGDDNADVYRAMLAAAPEPGPEKDRPHWLPPHWTRQGPGQYTRSDGLTIEPTDYYWRVTPRSGEEVHLRDKAIEEAIAWTDRHMPRAREALAQSGKGRAGWKLVPVEPTEEMIEAGCIGEPTMAQETEDVYRAMLASAPEPGPENGD